MSTVVDKLDKRDDIRKELIRKELVRQIREAGECLIKNADSIVGDEINVGSIDIDIEIDYPNGPRIHLNREFVPEKHIYSQED